LGLDLTEIEAGGAKLILANPQFITGALGWIALFFVLASVVRTQEAWLFRGQCLGLAETTDIARSKHATSLAFILYILLMLLLFGFVGMALIASCGDMYYILQSFMTRAFGLQDFVGPFEICVDPRQ
jgi:hypothetical protein